MDDYTDLKERLLDITRQGTPQCVLEAVAAITALEARVAKLTGALKGIDEAERNGWQGSAGLGRIARTALENTNGRAS